MCEADAKAAGNRPALDERGNALRVMAEAVRWGKRGARVNTISPGIVITPLAKDELTGPRGEGYRRMIELCPVGRAATPDEVGAIGALLMGTDGAFITGSDFLMDGGVTASYWYGNEELVGEALAPVRDSSASTSILLRANGAFTPRPPHRSGQAQLRHPAPASGNWRQVA
jgi:hypothetical protein